MTFRPGVKVPLFAAMLAFAMLWPVLGIAQTQPESTPGPAAQSSATETTLPAPPAATPAPTTAAPGNVNPDVSLKLPRDLSPWGMFMAADIIVKAVMVGLVFASVLTWTIWFAKAIELMSARRSLRDAIAALAQARSWEAAATAMQNRADSVGALVRSTNDELRLSAGAFAEVKERIASRLERIESGGSRAMIRGTGILATIGATAPFVGLFGTVWACSDGVVVASTSPSDRFVTYEGCADG
jgi:biopolymer transport protein ExbB